MSDTSPVTATVRKWLAEPLPRDVSNAIDRLARSDDVQHVAVMPDVHLAHEVCVGMVVATTRLIFPDAVGGDIGCGMTAVAFDAPADMLADDANAGALLAGLRRTVPIIRHSAATQPALPVGLLQQSLSAPRLDALLRRDGRVQFGTLGRGNHFLEFQSDEEGRLWLMVHSGSRAMGPAIRDLHRSAATASATGLRRLDADTPAGRAYLADADWARTYARESRLAMTDAASRLMGDLFSVRTVTGSLIACDHNHVVREEHFGQAFWVHRKGAMPAGAGVPGVIPGSMGTQSFHVEGRGNAAALCSSSHGAGRAMSRDEARRRVSEKDLRRQLREVWVDPRTLPLLREEAPSAYKDIRAVFRAQKDLTRIVRRLRPVLCCKGG